MGRIWAKGVWIIHKKKIFLTPIPVYDTISIDLKNGKTKDSLTLSIDEISSRIYPKINREISVFEVSQSLTICPLIMQYKKGNLYVIKNGKKQKKKINNGYYIKAFNPWYTKFTTTL
jgi:hypothetical protein